MLLFVSYSIFFLSEPYTEYKIFVKAFTRKNDGNPSDTVVNKTDISGPSEPRILNLTCQTQDTIFVQWERPAQILHSLDYYYIYRSAGGRSLERIDIEANKDHIDTSVSIWCLGCIPLFYNYVHLLYNISCGIFWGL